MRWRTNSPYRLWLNLVCEYPRSEQGTHNNNLRDLILSLRIRLSPVDAILTRMGAYDNMFSNASTFKVELDEWCVDIRWNAYCSSMLTSMTSSCKILREATPKSLVILDGKPLVVDVVPCLTWLQNLEEEPLHM